LTKTAPKNGERYAKFKIIGVHPITGGFETKQLVSLNVRSNETAWEQNATWRISWRFGEDPDTPLITSLALEEFEEVLSSKGGTWFSDRTASVFANETAIATEQLGLGIGAWKERLNDYLLVMQYGHNGIAVGDVNGDGFEDLYRCQPGRRPPKPAAHRSTRWHCARSFKSSQTRLLGQLPRCPSHRS
jgi:hypothetical protein